MQEWYLGRTLADDERKQVTFTTSLPASGRCSSLACGRSARCRSICATGIKALAPKYFLIGYQQEIFGLDNVDYFKRWERDEDYRWTHVAIPHIKDNYYLFGVRK